MVMAKCIFLDRDGVLNVDLSDYLYRLEDFVLIDGVKEALEKLKAEGYLLVVITNQAGIAKGRYTSKEVYMIHDAIQEKVGGLLDDLYYAPYHESTTQSLTRKPGRLLFEKAIAKYDIDVAQSWMIGDKERDLVPAQKLGIKGIRIADGTEDTIGEGVVPNILDAVEQYILK